jgi:alpha-galactosidase/6-phospho-beta-glucosidase family protein
MSQKLKVVTIGGGSSYTLNYLKALLSAIMNYRFLSCGWLMSTVEKRNWTLFLTYASA